MNNFQFDGKGNLLHFINDELRATVPESSIVEYQESWPDAPSAPVTPVVAAEHEEVQS